MRNLLWYGALCLSFMLVITAQWYDRNQLQAEIERLNNEIVLLNADIKARKTDLQFLNLFFDEVIKESQRRLESSNYWEQAYYREQAKPPVETVVYTYPTSQPYTQFVSPITKEQALGLLEGMKQSHIAALTLTPTTDFEKWLIDADFQRLAIEWYDQLLDYVRGR